MKTHVDVVPGTMQAANTETRKYAESGTKKKKKRQRLACVNLNGYLKRELFRSS